MSDNSMAFLAGGAFAGIAVLLVLKGGVNPSQANLQPIVQQSPLAAQSAAIPPNPNMAPGSQYGGSYTEQQRLMEDRVKDQLEQLKAQVRTQQEQMRNQQMVIDSLTSQTQANTLNPQLKPAQQVLAPVEQSSNPIFTGMLWALGGAAVTLGGGIFVIGTLALFSQQRGRRTVQVIHPLNNYQPTLQPSRRRSEFLPPRIVESKRVEEVEYD